MGFRQSSGLHGLLGWWQKEGYELFREKMVTVFIATACVHFVHLRIQIALRQPDCALGKDTTTLRQRAVKEPLWAMVVF